MSVVRFVDRDAMGIDTSGVFNILNMTYDKLWSYSWLVLGRTLSHTRSLAPKRLSNVGIVSYRIVSYRING